MLSCNRWSLAGIFLSVVAGPLLFAQKETPPEGGPPKPFHSPARDVFTLPNGLKVTLARYGMIPKVTVELALRGGYLLEPKSKDGVANLMAALMKEGTASRTAKQIADDAARFGGNITVRASADQVTIHAEGLSDSVDKMIALVADVALHPAFPESQLARLKTDQLRAISIARSTPQTIAEERFRKIVYGDNGYGRVLPDETALKSVTVEDIKAYYTKQFVASDARLYIAGDYSGNLRPAVQTAFAAWSKGESPDIPKIEAETKRTLDVVDRPGAPQSTIYMGLPVITPGNQNYIRLQVANSLLGGSFMSRITSNIREDKGYTYSPYSLLETNAQNGVWAQHADVTTKDTGASLHEINSEIDRLRREAPPQKELTGIQNGMAGIFILRNSSREGIVNMLNFVDLHRLPSDYLDTYIGKMYAVKPPDVQGMMEKYIDPSKMTIVVVGDRSQIDSQLAPYRPKH